MCADISITACKKRASGLGEHGLVCGGRYRQPAVQAGGVRWRGLAAYHPPPARRRAAARLSTSCTACWRRSSAAVVVNGWDHSTADARWLEPLVRLATRCGIYSDRLSWKGTDRACARRLLSSSDPAVSKQSPQAREQTGQRHVHEQARRRLGQDRAGRAACRSRSWSGAA